MRRRPPIVLRSRHPISLRTQSEGPPMRLVLAVFVCALLAGCATWRAGLPAELRPAAKEVKHLLVVTKHRAFEMDAMQSDNREVRGAVLRAWNLSPALKAEEVQ